MDCVCGCGTRIKRGLVNVHLQATSVALELLAWDKARTEGRIPREEAEAIDSLVHRGALQYQRLLATIHGERESAPLAEGESWLEESEALRRDRRHMSEKAWVKKFSPLRLTEEEINLLDRKHPERTFSGRADSAAGAGSEAETQMQRLSALHAEGVLSDEEFAAAKRRVLG